MTIPEQVKCLSRYIEEPDNFMINYIQHEINRVSLDEYLESNISTLDASKVWENGLRPIQTISYIYVRAITEIIYTIINYVKDETKQNVYFAKLLERHNSNIEYEKEHTPIDYDSEKKPKSKVKHNIINKSESSQRHPRKRDEISAAERKLINHIAKINTLKLNLKH